MEYHDIFEGNSVSVRKLYCKIFNGLASEKHFYFLPKDQTKWFFEIFIGAILINYPKQTWRKSHKNTLFKSEDKGIVRIITQFSIQEITNKILIDITWDKNKTVQAISFYYAREVDSVIEYLTQEFK